MISLGRVLRRSRPAEAPSFALPRVRELPGLELLVTDEPVIDYDRRQVLDRVKLRFDEIDQWTPFKLRGERREHVFEGRARHRGWLMELEMTVTLHGHRWREYWLRQRADMLTDRIWLSRGYVHADRRSACFRAAPAQAPFEGRVWFATVKPLTREIAGETEHAFAYGQTPTGDLSVELHAGFRFDLAWKSHADGSGRDYRAVWMHDAELISESIQRVYRMPGVTACASVMAGDYCDRDDI